MPPASRLEEILAHTRVVVEQRKAQADFAAMELAAAAHTPRGFLSALHNRSASGVAVIAELKKASPSKGLIRADFDVATLAAELAAHGAAALSVLTEERWFLGSLANLQLASQRADTVPCLRKDFLVDRFQVLEARAHGADAILLLAAALEDAALVAFAEEAYARDLDVLCEVHTAEELDRVLALPLNPARTALGVNSRDLHTFGVSLDATVALADRCRARHAGTRFLLVAESGIRNAEDIQRLRKAGYGAFLIGESIMRAPEPGRFLAEMLTQCG